MQNLTILALAVPEISLGPQNLNWATWPWPRPFQGWFVILPMISLSTKFEVSISTHYNDMKGDEKYRKW